MKTTRKNILLMTATITPENAPDLARVDPVERLHDYEKALGFYLGHVGETLHGILFVENSDSDVSSLRALVADRGLTDRVEFIANYGQFRYAGRERAYGEFKLLDHAMTTSRMVAEAGSDAVVWKITGRYTVINLEKVVRKAPKKFDVYCDMKNLPTPWMDLRFVGWTSAGYQKVFLGCADSLGVDPREPVMRTYVGGKAAEVLIVQRFRNEPLVEGVRGWDNQNYAKGKNLMKYYLRSLARLVTPWLWI